jgi:tetratricopeptide (TPR) repeat protein
MRSPVARRRPPARGVLLLVLLALLAGCASAGKRYEQGVELEQRGRSVEAARRYVEALRKDPGLLDARRRLEEAGHRAFDDLLRESSALDAAGRPIEAAEALVRLEGLRQEAAGVGVALSPPAGYESIRSATFDRAVEAALAAVSIPAGRAWSDVLHGLERAEARFASTPEQRERLELARLDAHLGWAEMEAERGRYRSAFEVAERGLRGAARSPGADRLADIREEALRNGSMAVAVLPTVADEEVAGRLHEELGAATDDALAERHWRAPPLFVSVLDPARVAREARREGFTRRPPTGREAARLAREMGAELAVIAELDSVRVGDAQVRDTRRAVRTREGADTAYLLREGRREAWARLSLTLVDARDGRVLDRATAAASQSARFRRGVYAGDWRTLALPRGDRDLFTDSGGERDRRELALQLADELAERAARDVFEAVLRQVP